MEPVDKVLSILAEDANTNVSMTNMEAASLMYQHISDIATEDLHPNHIKKIQELQAKRQEAKSLATTTNPKDLLGIKKVSLTKLPAVAEAWGAMAMMDGAAKYGAYNWRDKDVVASIYIDAARRHLQTWFEGQETASDSKVHHLGHAIACCAILLDAQFTGNLIDDRPVKEETDRFAEFLDKLSNIIKEKNAVTKG